MEIVFGGRKKIWGMKTGEFEDRGECNHEEADTKIVIFACESNANVVAVAADCDILVLMIFAYANHRPEFEWQLRYDVYNYANIEPITRRLGDEVSKLLSNYHAISGCDTTSYFYGHGKIIPYKRAIDMSKFMLLSKLGNEVQISTECMDECKEFVRTVFYNGKAGDSYLQTRIKIYDRQPAKSKSTMSIPPDEDSCEQHILRCHHRAYEWKHSNMKIIPSIDKYAIG